MTTTLDRVMAAAVAFLSLLLVVSLGALAWKALQDAGAAAAAGASDAAEDLRLLGALLLVVLVFLVGALGMVAAHVRGATRQPLRELIDGLRRIGKGAVRERIVPQGPSELRAAIAAVNEVAESLADQQAQLTRTVTMGTIDALINGVAHEVNTPLTPLLLDTHLALQTTKRIVARDDLPPESREALARIVRMHERTQAGLTRLGRLGQALREVARSDRAMAPRDLGLIVTAVLALTRHRMPAGAELLARVTSARPVSCVAWDLFYALYEVVLHIADALRGAQTLEVWLSDEADRVIVSIRTTAHLFPSGAIDALQTPADVSAGGLAGARSALEAAGAEVTVRSDPVTGTLWRVSLKAADPSEATAPASRPLRELRGPAA